MAFLDDILPTTSTSTFPAASEAASQSRAHLSTSAKAEAMPDGISALGVFRTSPRTPHLLPSGLSPRPYMPAIMSGVQFTIGSFGDFTALLQLTFAVRRAFVEAQGASDDIKGAITRIDAFTLAVQGVRGRLEKAQDVPMCVRNGINHSLAACTNALLRVERRIEPHRKRIEKALGSKAWRGYWAAAAWSILGGKVEVESIMSQLTEQVIALQTFLGLLQSTALDSIESRQDINAAGISKVVACIQSLAARVQSPPPFQFFDHDNLAVEPLLKLSWGNFVDLWTEHDFFVNVSDLNHGELYKAGIAVPRPGSLVWFNLYIYDDPQAFNTPTALISPIYFQMGPDEPPKRSYCLSRLFLTSATWLAKTLENPISERAPLIGPRSRKQLMFLETGFRNDIHGSLHTPQYFLDTAPGPAQPEGRPSIFGQNYKRLEGYAVEQRKENSVGSSSGF